MVEEQREGEVEDVRRAPDEVVQVNDAASCSVLSDFLCNSKHLEPVRTHSRSEARTQPSATTQPRIGSPSTTLTRPRVRSPTVISEIAACPPALAAAARPIRPPGAPLAAASETVERPENSRQSITIEIDDGPPSYDRSVGEAKSVRSGGRRNASER